MKTLRIATRGSDLALTQTRHIARRIASELDVETELVVIRTTGDRIQDRSLSKIGGKGLFVKEIEEALVDGRADVAVHSAKDMPAQLAKGCVLAAYPEREDPRDALCARESGMTIDDLPPGARIGTGSTRRIAQLLRQRPDLEIVPLRGNVPTRLDKIEGDDLAGVILACAGLDRLGLSDRIDERIDPETMLPSVGQGLLALETREDGEWAERIATLESKETGSVARVERAFQSRLGGDCSVPLAGYAEPTPEGGLFFRGLLLSLDGRGSASAEGAGPMAAAESIGRAAAETVLAKGGDAILSQLAEDAKRLDD